MHDLIVRGATVVDGTGVAAYSADIAIGDGLITEIGEVSGTARREINAEGRLVTPGFVDAHTHYDGQATWDSDLAPSSWHGVTTVVMGNCGVGFAPARPDERDFMIQVMEGVEDSARGKPVGTDLLPTVFILPRLASTERASSMSSPVSEATGLVPKASTQKFRRASALASLPVARVRYPAMRSASVIWLSISGSLADEKRAEHFCSGDFRCGKQPSV